MKKDIRLLGIEIKSHLLAYLCPILLIYIVFVPYCLYQIQYITDKESMEITYFMLSQQYLPIFMIWFQWLIIRNYVDGQLIEVLLSQDVFYKIRFILYGFVFYIFILIPYFVLSYMKVGDISISLLSLIFEFLILSVMFYGFSFILKNSLITVGFLMIFVLLFSQFFVLENSYILFHITVLAKNLDSTYWIIQSIIGVVITSVGIYIEKKKLMLR